MDVDIRITAAPLVLPESDYLRRHPPRYVLSACTHIPRPLAEVFAFFSSPQNLALLTPPEMGLTIVGTPPAGMSAGLSVDYRMRVARLPIVWRTFIEVWEPGVRFVDTQTRGPYACWWHEHRFAADAGGTAMGDTVLYAAPFGVLGSVAQHVFIARELRRVFAFRTSVIRQRFG